MSEVKEILRSCNLRPTKQRLMIGQDTGSAIKGFIRGDIFFGSGYEAGQIAGQMKEKGNIIIFLLKDEII